MMLGRSGLRVSRPASAARARRAFASKAKTRQHKTKAKDTPSTPKTPPPLKSGGGGGGGAREVVLVDGVRLPFKKASTDYNDYMAYDLQRMALKGLVDKNALDTSVVDYIVCGTVIQEVQTHNIAREAAVGAGFPTSIPAHTVGQACISSAQAAATGAEKILAGRADVVIAGGVDIMSDVPIRFSGAMRKKMLKANKVARKGAPAMLKEIFKGGVMKTLMQLAPETPGIANFLTGEVMGHSADRLCSAWGVSRAEQDAFAVASHTNAASAHAAGKYEGEVIPVEGDTTENGIRSGVTTEDIAGMKPAFVKPHGTVTAGNASFLSDGASAALLMADERAEQLGYAARATLQDWTFVSVDPFDELLLGPAYAIAKILKANGLTVADIDVWEIHEAFAGQVLCNLNALDSDAFAANQLQGAYSGKVGAPDFDKINQWGGSLAIGHPFGATGARILTTAANRLHDEDGQFALTAACADGGLANAMLLRRA